MFNISNLEDNAVATGPDLQSTGVAHSAAISGATHPEKLATGGRNDR